MKLFTYLQILSLILIAGVVGYFLIPKYTFFRYEDSNIVTKANKFTGEISWQYVVKPMLHKVKNVNDIDFTPAR